MSRGPIFRLQSEKIQLSEKDVTKACLGLLALHKYWIRRNHVGLFKTPDDRYETMGTKGDPDYTLAHGTHRNFLLELKRPGGKLSPAQEKRIEEIKLFYPGLSVAVIECVEDLRDWLWQHERSP